MRRYKPAQVFAAQPSVTRYEHLVDLVQYFSSNWDIEDMEKLWKDKVVAGNALVSVLALP